MHSLKDNQSRIFQSVNFEEKKSIFYNDEDGDEIDLEKVESVIQNIMQENQQIQDELNDKIGQLEQKIEEQKEEIKGYQIKEQKLKIQSLIKQQNNQNNKELYSKVEKL